MILIVAALVTELGFDLVAGVVKLVYSVHGSATVSTDFGFGLTKRAVVITYIYACRVYRLGRHKSGTSADT